jgi:hypothetical protein
VKIVKHFKPTRKLEELQDKMAETNFVTLKGKKISNNLAHVEYTSFLNRQVVYGV